MDGGSEEGRRRMVERERREVFYLPLPVSVASWQVD